MLMWTAGDIALTIESLTGRRRRRRRWPTPSTSPSTRSPTSPSCCCCGGSRAGSCPPLARRGRRGPRRRGRVRGVRVPDASCTWPATARRGACHQLAYPVGDVLLLALAVGGTVLLVGSAAARAWPWSRPACAVNAVGDTFNLVQPTTHLGGIIDGIAWPSGDHAHVDGGVAAARTGATCSPTEAAPGFLLPGLGRGVGARDPAASAAGDHVDPVAVGLATATLVVVGRPSGPLGRAASVRSPRSAIARRSPTS